MDTDEPTVKEVYADEPKFVPEYTTAVEEVVAFEEALKLPAVVAMEEIAAVE